MKRKLIITGTAILVAMIAIGPVMAKAQDAQVLVTVGELNITANELESALISAPFATQFATMDEKGQAALRGDMLRRLVNARLLRLEAQTLGLDRSSAFIINVEKQRAALLYRHYMDKLRERILIPPETLAAMEQQFKDDHDGLESAKSAYKADQYRTAQLMTIRSLQERYDVKLHEERIVHGVSADAVLLEGKDIQIRYGDVVDTTIYPNLPNPEWIKEQLYKRAELLLVSKMAAGEGVDVADKLQRYQEERLPAMMLEQKEKDWIPDDQVLRDWFEKHPEVAKVPETRHIGQLVVASRGEAENLRSRILKGESLFVLAGQYSIDQAGRQMMGDMGWVIEGRGYPQLDQAASTLKDGEVSEVIETPKGFHLITVLERRPGGVRDFITVKDRVRQFLLQERLESYLKELEQRYKVVWLLKDREMTSTESGAK